MLLFWTGGALYFSPSFKDFYTIRGSANNWASGPVMNAIFVNRPDGEPELGLKLDEYNQRHSLENPVKENAVREDYHNSKIRGGIEAHACSVHVNTFTLTFDQIHDPDLLWPVDKNCFTSSFTGFAENVSWTEPMEWELYYTRFRLLKNVP